MLNYQWTSKCVHFREVAEVAIEVGKDLASGSRDTREVMVFAPNLPTNQLDPPLFSSEHALLKMINARGSVRPRSLATSMQMATAFDSIQNIFKSD